MAKHLEKLFSEVSCQMDRLPSEFVALGEDVGQCRETSDLVILNISDKVLSESHCQFGGRN